MKRHRIAVVPTINTKLYPQGSSIAKRKRSPQNLPQPTGTVGSNAALE
jgi:hypothetical protein